MLWISLDRSANSPLIQQVYVQLRKKILSGELTAGEKLPSTRQLADLLGI